MICQLSPVKGFRCYNVVMYMNLEAIGELRSYRHRWSYRHRHLQSMRGKPRFGFKRPSHTTYMPEEMRLFSQVPAMVRSA